MDYIWMTTSAVLLLAGLIGCFLPILPGPPLSYAGLLVLQLKETPPFGTKFLIIWAVVTVVVTALDYFIPAFGTKKFGGSKKGVWGSLIGLVLGVFFFPPFGIIIGPILGAIVGELIDGKEMTSAVRSGMGSFLGFLVGTLIKLIASVLMIYYFIIAVFYPDQVT